MRPVEIITVGSVLDNCEAVMVSSQGERLLTKRVADDPHRWRIGLDRFLGNPHLCVGPRPKIERQEKTEGARNLLGDDPVDGMVAKSSCFLSF